MEQAKKDLINTRRRQSTNKFTTIEEVQRDYSSAERDLASAKARLDAVVRKARERIPESEARFKVGERVWVVTLRLYGTITKILGFSVYNGIVGAMYEVETARREVYHEAFLRGGA